jgi:uncharacterized Zn-binding protein involved in type VI secretion
MSNNARQLDMHSHGGYILSGSPDVYTNGLQTARLTDLCMCPQHGIVSIIQGSATVYDNGLQRARLGDMLSCGAFIIQGSPDVYTGD